MSEPKTSVRRLHAIERQRRALELRKAGASFDEIGSTLGYRGKSGAYQAVMSALKRTLQEPADEVRKLELARLDRAQRTAWERMLHGDLDALGKVLKVMERRAKLLGLDAPAKVAPTDPSGEGQYEGLTDDELVRRLMAIIGTEATAAVGGDPAAPVGVPAGLAESPA